MSTNLNYFDDECSEYIAEYEDALDVEEFLYGLDARYDMELRFAMECQHYQCANCPLKHNCP